MACHAWQQVLIFRSDGSYRFGVYNDTVIVWQDGTFQLRGTIVSLHATREKIQPLRATPQSGGGTPMDEVTNWRVVMPNADEMWLIDDKTSFKMLFDRVK